MTKFARNINPIEISSCGYALAQLLKWNTTLVFWEILCVSDHFHFLKIQKYSVSCGCSSIYS